MQIGKRVGRVVLAHMRDTSLVPVSPKERERASGERLARLNNLTPLYSRQKPHLNLFMQGVE